MTSPITLWLDKETRQRIARIARRRRLSTSQVIRDAIEAWVERQEATASPYEAMADLIGIVHGENSRRSTGAGRQFRERLKRRGKRS